MHSDLIYDVGLHRGGDSLYYISQGYRVVAVDAESQFIRLAQTRFVEEIASGQLTLVHAAIGPRDNDEITFYVSKVSDWSSIDINVAEREDSASSVRVQSRTLASIMAQYGTPVYCKIDIEGADAIALESLKSAVELPPFISCEAECSGRERWSDDRSLETLVLLQDLGYRRFKLVDQVQLATIPAKGKFYRDRWKWDKLDRFINRVSWRLAQWRNPDIWHRTRLEHQHGFRFEGDVSGPWGESLDGRWMDFSMAKAMYLRHRQDYYNRKSFSGYGFWVDWHACM